MHTRTLATLAATLLALGAVSGLAAAAERGDGDRGYGDRGDRREAGQRDGQRDSRRGYVYDNRYGHGHYYPERGETFRHLPSGGYYRQYRDESFYFYGGTWYRPWGPQFRVIAPPIGIGLELLPPYYTTVWVGGVPYYYADGTYYLWRPERREYVVTAAPPDAAPITRAPPANPELYAYPRNGQSEEQQATDRYECHKWASGQAGFDPTQPLGGASAAEATARRDDYQRAQRACLEGRGYSVN